MVHGGGVEDNLTHLRMGHRPMAIHTGYIPYRGSGAVCRVYAAMTCRGPHHSLLHRVCGFKDLQSLPDMSRLLDQAALVLAGSQRVV